MKTKHLDPDAPFRAKLRPRWMPREMVTPPFLNPYPGTPFLHQMEREGRLLHKDWSRYEAAGGE